MAVIDIGNAAVSASRVWGDGYTHVDKVNPANESGTITSVEIYASIEMSSCEVGIFYEVDTNELYTRDYETVDNGNGAGVVPAGSKQTFTVNLDVVAGDYIGIYFATGDIDYTSDTSNGYWYVSGDEIPCVGTYMTLVANANLSLYGIGATPAVNNAIFIGANF